MISLSLSPSTAGTGDNDLQVMTGCVQQALWGFLSAQERGGSGFWTGSLVIEDNHELKLLEGATTPVVVKEL